MIFDQSEFEIRCEWGENGVAQLAPISDVVIIVDILSFSTCVEIANRRGAIVFPYQWKDKTAQEFATSIDAELADRRNSGTRYELSPASLAQIPNSTKLVLPSPNGSALSLKTGNTPTLAGCLRNSHAIATSATTYGKRIALIPAGEKWENGSLRPSFEDWIGAGAILSYLKGTLSPEAQIAIAAYQSVQSNLKSLLKQCSSGKELIAKGFEQDVDLAAEINVSTCVPTLVDRAYLDRTCAF
ncbi:MAG: 2-phosphosulfolactate phosphatase [Phormidium tanganyikae FI6-MK23]|jgi:2-phosphosulfolactate phosphatase|nr:2-phosphosulfolactate phosphatase [Phormidium tanganyikae FI6-MK23]